MLDAQVKQIIPHIIDRMRVATVANQSKTKWLTVEGCGAQDARNNPSFGWESPKNDSWNRTGETNQARSSQSTGDQENNWRVVPDPTGTGDQNPISGDNVALGEPRSDTAHVKSNTSTLDREFRAWKGSNVLETYGRVNDGVYRRNKPESREYSGSAGGYTAQGAS